MSNLECNEFENLENLISKNDFLTNNETIKESFNVFYSILKNQTNQITKLEDSIKKNKKKLKEYKTNLKTLNIDNVNLLINNKIDEIKLEIKDLKQINEKKLKNSINTVNKNENTMINDLNKKFEIIDTNLNEINSNINEQFKEFNEMLNNLKKDKVDYEDLSKLIDNINNKIDLEILSKFTNEINESMCKLIETNNTLLKNEFNENFNKFKNLDNEIKNMNIKEIEKLDFAIKNIDKKIENSFEENTEINSKINLNDYNIKELEKKINNLLSIINKESIKNTSNYNNCNQIIRTIYNDLNKFKIMMQNELTIKPYTEDIHTLIEKKIDNRILDSTIYEINKFKEKNEENNNELYNEHRRLLTDSNQNSIKNNLNHLKNDNISNQIIQIKNSLKNKVNINDFNNLSSKIKKYNNNIIGKWISTNNKLNNGYIIWDIESQISSKNYFIFENNNIIIKNEGIYKIEFILFLANNQNLNFSPNVAFIINEKILKNYNNFQNEILDEKIGMRYNELLNLNKMTKINISINNDLINEFKGILLIKSI